MSTTHEAAVRHPPAAPAGTLLLMASSWRLGANILGKPRVFTPCAGGMARDGFRAA